MGALVELKENKDIYNYKQNEKTKKNRNYYLDTARGLAAIMVILIHTAFHSGNSYVPPIVANFTLLFEVPAFFFLAGWSFSYSKSNKNYVKGLLNIQIKYMLYMFLVFVAINITNFYSISNNPVNETTLINWFFHNYESTAPFSSISGSLWFFRVYFFVSIIGMVVITVVKPKYRKYICIACLIAVVLISFFFPSARKIDIGITIDYLFFYLFFFLLGYLLKDSEVNGKQFGILCAITVILLAVIRLVTEENIWDIQNHKFPPHLIYLLWSMFGIYLIVFAKRYFSNIKKNVISKVGENSIYFYFAQGIGASCLYFISQYITFAWYWKLPIMFGINFIITIIFSIILKKIIDPITKWLDKITFEDNKQKII